MQTAVKEAGHSAVLINGWECSDCGIICPRDVEESNSVWSSNTNADREYWGVALEYSPGGLVIGAVSNTILPGGVQDEFGTVCPDCGVEYPGCCLKARVPCMDCREPAGKGSSRTTYSKPWHDGWTRTPSITHGERSQPEYSTTVAAYLSGSRPQSPELPDGYAYTLTWSEKQEADDTHPHLANPERYCSAIAKQSRTQTTLGQFDTGDGGEDA